MADLDELGAGYTEVPFSDTVADDFDASTEGKVVLWYHGGPGAAGETQPMVGGWSVEERDNYRQLLADGHQVLLMDQSQGMRDYTVEDYFGFPHDNYFRNGWVGLFGYSAPNSSQTFGTCGINEGYGTPDERITAWASGMATDDGIGFGGSYGFIPICPNSFVGSPDGYFGAYSTQAAERYTGGGSSGQVPVQLGFGNVRQFTGIGEYPPIFQGGAQNFNHIIGVAAYPNAPTFGYDLGHLSWGNQAAPDSASMNSFYQGYSHSNGPGKLWVCGWGWAETTIAAPAGMTRAQLLRNMLAWLNGSLTFAAVTNKGYEAYTGIPEVVSTTAAYWDPADNFYRTAAQTPSFDGGLTTGVYPDQSSPNLYYTGNNPAFNNEIQTTDPRNGGTRVNGNDVDNQFPGWFCYVRDVSNNGVANGVAPGATDDTCFIAGFLVNDTGTAPNTWTRFTPPAGTFPVSLWNLSNPRPEVAGFYSTTGDNGTGDTFGNYGSEPAATDAYAAGKEFKNSNKLTVETIAHWPATLQYFDFSIGGNPPNPQPAKIYWTMYPGQNLTIPGTTQIVGVNATWDQYRNSFNVDPAASPANRTGSRYNQPNFSYLTNVNNDGRVVEFNYRTVKQWNPDIDRNGIRNNADKFPVRNRLFTYHQGYYNKAASPASVWPNHLFDPGDPPPNWHTLNPGDPGYPTFIEGGTYVVDFGDPNYPMVVQDDPAQPDPGATGTITGSGPGNYLMDFYLIIRMGNGPYTVQFDFDCPAPQTFGDGSNNRVSAAYNIADPGNIAILDVPLKQTGSQTWGNLPNGTYTMGVQVTDSTAIVAPPDPNQVVFARLWTGVIVAPPALIVETFESGSFGTLPWTLEGHSGYGGSKTAPDWQIRNTAHPYFGYTAQQGSRYATYTDGTSDYGNYVAEAIKAGPFSVSANTTYTMTWYTHGWSESSFDGLQMRWSLGASSPTNQVTYSTGGVSSPNPGWRNAYYSPYVTDGIVGSYYVGVYGGNAYSYYSNCYYGNGYYLGYVYGAWQFRSYPIYTYSATTLWISFTFVTDYSVSTMGGPLLDNIRLQ
jgi:hypothetical protein